MQISGFEKLILLEEFEYHAKSNFHSCCNFTILIKKEDEDSYSNLIGKECKIQGHADDCYDKSMADFVFVGIVKHEEFSSSVEGCFLSVHIEGLSVYYDTESESAVKRRIFQNPEKKMKDILTSINLSEWNITSDDDSEIPEVLIQDDLTDWNFLLNVCSAKGWNVYPSADSKKVCVGYFADDCEKQIEENLLIDVRKKISSINKGMYSTVTCVSEQYLNLGNTVFFRGEKYTVDNVHIKRSHNTFVKTYTLVQYCPLQICMKSDYLLHAKVVNNEDPDKKGRLQVEFSEPDESKLYEDVMKKNPVWIDMSVFFATKDTGVSFLPEKDDVVLVNIKNGNAQILSSVRTESFGDKLEDYNKKYVFFSNDRLMEVNEDELVFKSKKCEFKISDENINLLWDKKINFKIVDGMLSVYNNEHVKYEISEDSLCVIVKNTAVELNDDIQVKSGKSLKVDGNSSIDMKASKININGNGGVSIN